MSRKINKAVVRTEKAKEKDFLLQKMSEFIDEFSELDDSNIYKESVQIINDIDFSRCDLKI